MGHGYSLGTFVNGESMASNITSSTLDVGDFKNVSIQFRAASGTHVGTASIDGSNDGSNWTALPLSSTPTAASGSAWDELVELEDISCRYIRMVYTAGSGTGTLYCYGYGK